MTSLTITFKHWLPFAVIGFFLALLTYTGIQQDLRQGANDPQIQMTEDAAVQLSNGTAPSAVVPSQTVDVATSLSPWLTVTDRSGTVLASSARLNGSVPLPPSGALAFAVSHPDNRITWQPESTVRQAVVIKAYGGSHPGFVIAGRSLREVETREDRLTLVAGLDLLGLLIGTFFVLWLFPLQKS